MPNSDKSNANTPKLTMFELARATAQLLGYQARPPDPEVRYERAEIEGPNEVLIHWYVPYSPKDRVEVHGVFPTWHDEYSSGSYTPRERIKITIARDSTPEHAASEIRRRFLPTYLAQLSEAKDSRTAWLDRNADIAKTVTMLEQCGARRKPKSRDQLVIDVPGDASGDIRVDCASVRMELRDLSRSQATAILGVLCPTAKP